MFLSRLDENAMKSFEEVLKQNPNILEQIRKETDEWLKELQERKMFYNGK